MLESKVSSAFPEVYKLILLFVAIPVSVVTIERCFSNQKLMGSYLRSAMRRERLENLGGTFYWKHRGKDDCMTNFNYLTEWNLTGTN